MSEKIEMNAEVRSTIRKGVGALRRSGKVPAIVYGAHVQPLSLQLDLRDATNVLRKC